MNYVIYLGILLLLILIIAFPFPLKISIKFNDNKFNIYLYNFKIKCKKKNNSSTKKEEKFLKDSLKEKYNNFISMKNKIFKTNHKIKVKLKLDIKYGLEDPFQTAMINGLLWACLSFLFSYSLNYLIFKSKDINIKPDFKKEHINILMIGIIYLNIAKIIYIIFLVLKNKIHKRSNKVT